MNLLDIILLVVTTAALLLGLRKGVISQVGDIAAMVAGVAVCRLMPERAMQLSRLIVGDRMGDMATVGWIEKGIGYMLLFAVVYIAVKIVARLLRTITHAAMLGPVDRVCGSLFMAAKCLLGLSIVLNVWLFISAKPTLTDECHKSLRPLHEAVISFAPSLLGAFSDGVSGLGDKDNASVDAGTTNHVAI